MGSSTEQRAGDLDTSQPGIRQIHGWIRDRTTITVELIGGSAIRGLVRWVDLQFLALETDGEGALVMINRDAIVLLRAMS